VSSLSKGVHLLTFFRVTVELKGRETEGVDIQTKPLHKKDPAIGTKQLVYSSTLIMEQEDAASFGDNEEVSLLPVIRTSVQG
jgi:glutamyl-tRNA synthetase